MRDTLEEDKEDDEGGEDISSAIGSNVGSMVGYADGLGVGAVGIGVGAVGTTDKKSYKNVQGEEASKSLLLERFTIRRSSDLILINNIYLV